MKRCVATALFLGLLGACKPAPGIPTTGPDAAASGPDDTAVAAEAGTVLRYDASARTLKQTGHLELVQRGAGRYAEALLDVDATITIQPKGDRLEVVWTVDEVTALELQGALQGDGPDPKAFLQEHGSGAYLSDLRGQAEDDPTLPQNVERESKLESMRAEIDKATAEGKPAPVMPGLQMLSYLPPLLQLPSLPEEALPLGEPVTVEREEETELGDTGIVLPFDVSVTYTLVRIDDSGNSRIAEMAFEGSAVGSQEGPGGPITIESLQKGSLLFDLDAKVPVAYEATRSETIEMGQFSGETETILRAAWEE